MCGEEIFQCPAVGFIIFFIQYYIMNHQILMFLCNKIHETVHASLHLYFCRTILFIIKK